MEKLGRYTIEEPLGEGSFAWVYRAFDQKLKRYVALKVLKPMWLNDSSAMRRFEQEATTMANLHHPHIAEIYDVDETEGQVYLAQFLVEGETLAHRLTRGALSWAETLAILKGMAAALDYAHGQGIIHRDIKPANILLAQAGQPYLSDFGLIRAAEGSVAISSSSGGMVGTASYMAPEQWRGQAATPATDVYALSCVAVEMLTGKRLFDAPSSAAIMTKHVMDPPELPAQWPPDVPEEVTVVLQRGLAKDPAERIGSAGELISALETLSPLPLPVAEEDEAPTVPPPFATRAAALWLVDSTGQSYEVKRGSLTLGRSAKCDIRIDDPQASREHAKLEFDGQHCMVYDQGSANGTFVNRQRVGPEGQSLKPGDHLTIGEASLTLSSLLPAKPPAAVKEPPMPSPPSEAPPVKPVSRRSSRALGVVALFGGGLVLLIMVGVIIFLVIQAGGPVAIPAPEAPAEQPAAEEPAAEEPAAEEPAVEAPAELPQTITAPDGATMILIPAGPFEMGSDADVALAECQKLFIGLESECQRSQFEDEEPKHTVTLDDFYIDQYEVTNAQYVVCVDDGVCDPPARSSSITRDSYYGHSEYGDYPVIYVSWEQATTYCERREARLPTEAEWEKAARGTDGRLYPWGDTFDGTRTNFCDRNCTLFVWANVDYDDGYADTAPVGSYSKGGSPYGVYDMAGNVWEWVADWYDENYYSSSPAVNPTGPASGEFRVLRGGAYNHFGSLVRVAARRSFTPTISTSITGFRCACSPEKPTASEALREEMPAVTETPVAETPTDIEASVEEEPAATEAPLVELPQTITAPDGATMILIPAGPFEMGSESGDDDEKPVHEVTLDAFYIDQYEVTSAQYAACVDDGVCDPPGRSSSSTRDSYYGDSEYDDYPVIYVNWHQAKAYCEWREARLPTEAEWEKAARGTDGRQYPWGDTFDGSRVNFCDSNCNNVWANSDYDDGYADTAPVGSYPNGVSPYGAYDMVGNVWEWVQSEYRSYPYQADDGRENLVGTNVRVLRGGSWGYTRCRAARRYHHDPDHRTIDLGFRCAVAASAP